MITLRQLEIFVDVVRAGSFRRCAEQLGMSQVSVSEHVRSLEDRLGTQLFERRPGSAPVITERGEAAYTHIVGILASIGDLVAQMDGGVSTSGRRLGVSMHSFLTRDLPPILRDFTAAYAKVEIRLDTDIRTQDELMDLVARRVLDLAYFFAFEDSSGARLVRHEPLALFVSNDHPLASAEIVALEDLAAQPVIQLTPRDPLRLLVDRAFASIGLAERPVAIESDDFGRILGSAQRGLGYTCLFDATSHNPVQSLGLKKLTLARQLPALEVRCASRPTAAQDSTLQAFSTFVEGRWEECDRRQT